MKNSEFNRLLRSRLNKKTGARMTTTALARSAGVGRSHLCQVLKNTPGRGGHTRRKLFPWLTTKEIDALGWRIEFEAWQKKTPALDEFRAFGLEQCSPWNIVPKKESL